MSHLESVPAEDLKAELARREKEKRNEILVKLDVARKEVRELEALLGESAPKVVRVRGQRGPVISLVDRQSKVLKIFDSSSDKFIPSSVLSEKTGLSLSQISDTLAHLVNDGQLTRTGNKRSTLYSVSEVSSKASTMAT